MCVGGPGQDYEEQRRAQLSRTLTASELPGLWLLDWEFVGDGGGDKWLRRVDAVSVQLETDTRFLGEAAAWSDDPGEIQR